MTISGFQSYAFSAVRLSMTVTSAASASPALAGAGSPASGAAIDRVSLSPESATAAATPDGAGTTVDESPDVPAPPAPDSPPPSRAARRADALFTALDGDKDGEISEDEFKDGALNLLRNAGARRRIDDDGDNDRRSARGLGRFERKLKKIFDSVDKNDDGAISKDELTAALSRGRGRRGGPEEAPPAEAPPVDAPTAGAGAFSISISVTYVSIAVQRYTSLQNTAAPDTPAAPSAQNPAGSTSTKAPADETESAAPALAA